MEEQYIIINGKKVQVASNAFRELKETERAMQISYKLLGENRLNQLSVVYHHIRDVLKHEGITAAEAHKLLLISTPCFSESMFYNIIQPILIHLKEIEKYS